MKPQGKNTGRIINIFHINLARKRVAGINNSVLKIFLPLVVSTWVALFLLVRVLFLTCLFCFIQPSFAFLWMFLKVEIHSNNVT